MPAIVTYSNTSKNVIAVRDRLVAKSVMPIDRIKIVGDFSQPAMQATSLLQLWPQDFTIEEAIEEGAGRNSLRINEPLMVIISNQLITDEVDSAFNAFLDPTFGHYAIRNNVMNALHEFWPTDSDGNALTVEPIKLQTGRKGEKPRVPRFKGWTTSILMFGTRYRQILDLEDQ